ncbi:MAG: hypothetical protein COT71_00475 [Candidatus Andersenbacteria bacterium CG10_big_fil_rev_8_21_14_0_10_54_11]|uniref:Uncharacterized protein n=1 Tax=Candidatus Andersenbacteria bacterium CG10_big_fil_rev_8_21_14_0_10_54_11 TaxID=1974485 RepID=A0A2M6X082_9BACT|nr:MAG: hypothetical protein COT71_00475 [Candidatus Andersenbacteria bacterium CG10_big_fil_rev_8_21_14_0_10_54_11]
MAAAIQAEFRRWGAGFVGGAFAVALALLLVLVLRSVAVQITPPPPSVTEPYPDVSTEALCEQEGGRWIVQPQEAFGPVRPAPEKIQPYCQGPLAFERAREVQAEASRQTSLFVFAVGGGLAVAAGVLLRTSRGVSPGLLLGGIVSFFFAGIEVWRLSPGIGRLITIAAVFLALVGLGLWVFREQHETVPSRS